ncbi:MAG: efflux transporter outer membrane subunit [Chromatiales bacterium]
MHKAAIAFVSCAISACTVGPDYERPEQAVASNFSQAEAVAVYTDAEPVTEFWRGFNDPQLTHLVENALAANHDLRASLARLNEARALAGLARFDRYPTVTAGAAFTESRLSEDEAPGLPREERDAGLFAPGIDAFWELDFFGRVRRSIEASEAEVEASAADLRALQVSIAAEVARSYFELRGRQEQLRVAQLNAQNQRETLRLTEARLDAGEGTDFDVARARGQLESTLSQIPVLEAAIATTIHRLAVLNGQQPAARKAELEAVAPLPPLPAAVAVGAPPQLLRRRPDIQAAERRLAAATARIGVATADLFPRVTFNGSLGLSSASLGDLFGRDAQSYSFGPSVSWAFLNLGRVRAQIAATDAAAEGNLALYEGTVLRALEEAENALVDYAKAGREQRHLSDSATARSDAAGLARVRFEGGMADFLQVLDAERSLLEAEDSLARSHTRTATALVAVYKALAGGWPERVPERPVAAR